jgi:hypothetical protein
MARRPMTMPLFEPTCDRRQFLAERDEMREMMRQDKRCHKINTRPGFQKLANMKFNRG